MISPGQVIDVRWWKDGGFGVDYRFYLLQQEMVADIVEVKGHFSRATLAEVYIPYSPPLRT